MIMIDITGSRKIIQLIHAQSHDPQNCEIESDCRARLLSWQSRHHLRCLQPTANEQLCSRTQLPINVYPEREVAGDGSKKLRPCQPHWRPKKSAWMLAFAWSTPGYCGQLGEQTTL